MAAITSARELHKAASSYVLTKPFEPSTISNRVDGYESSTSQRSFYASAFPLPPSVTGPAPTKTTPVAILGLGCIACLIGAGISFALHAPIVAAIFLVVSICCGAGGLLSAKSAEAALGPYQDLRKAVWDRSKPSAALIEHFEGLHPNVRIPRALELHRCERFNGFLDERERLCLLQTLESWSANAAHREYLVDLLAEICRQSSLIDHLLISLRSTTVEQRDALTACTGKAREFLKQVLINLNWTYVDGFLTNLPKVPADKRRDVLHDLAARAQMETKPSEKLSKTE